MVARITTPHRLADALNYNEQKVQKGKAECLYAGNYLKEGKEMNFYEKIAGFENRNILNDRATTKTLHISLNFDPSEKYSNERMVQIANFYLDRIGFGDQPYLVYKHDDAGHPHIHIVATTIREDGSRINTHNIGRNQSERARKETEQIFTLVKAEKQSQSLTQSIPQINIQKVNYGKDETKRAIANVINAVLSKYKFTSLAELNAVLHQFNVIADRGKEEGRIFKSGGLIYRALDDQGMKIGVPIKASSISTKPTLKALEERYAKNRQLREPYKEGLKEKIDTTISQKPGSLKELKSALSKQQVNLIVRQNSDGRVYGITFIDNKSNCVFNGSDLGKQYSAAGILKRMAQTEALVKKNQDTAKKVIATNGPEKTQLQLPEPNLKEAKQHDNTLVDDLLEAKLQRENTPFQLKRKRKKKKKQNPGF